ncbi:LOW QUALITY PROTEIN: hypothetical protein HID58_071735, partial [Brassica napus]
PQTGVPASVTQPSSLSVLVVVSIDYGFLRFWDSLNIKKDMEFVGITVLFLDEKGSDLTKQTTRVVICLLIDP